MEPVFPMPEPAEELPRVGPELARWFALMEESQARSRRLNELLATVAQLKARTESVLAEQSDSLKELTRQLALATHSRNTAVTRLCLMHEMLHRLCNVCDDVREEEGWDFPEGKFEKTVSEARELVDACKPYLK